MLPFLPYPWSVLQRIPRHPTIRFARSAKPSILFFTDREDSSLRFLSHHVLAAGSKPLPLRRPRHLPTAARLGTALATSPKLYGATGSSRRSASQGSAGFVKRVAQVVGSLTNIQLRPQKIPHLLSVYPVVWCQGQRLHQARRLLEPPILILDGSGSY